MKKVAIALLGAVILSSSFGAGSHVDAATTKTGWVKQNSSWYYYVSSTKETGWQQVGGKWYYFNQSGVMQTGWLKYKTSWYYLAKSGAMQTGWIQDAGKWYYLEQDGKMKTGWVKTSNKWYYLGKSGAMQTGWIVDQEKRYYLNQSGVMQKGWLKVGGKMYLFNPSGDAKIGWYHDKESDKEKIYYFNADGSMQTGWYDDPNFIPNSVTYYFSESGTALIGWQEIDGQTYYFASGGSMVRRNFVESRYLNSDGVLTAAGSDLIVSAAEELKKKIDVNMTREQVIDILGPGYNEQIINLGGRYDRDLEYAFKVSGENELTVVRNNDGYYNYIEDMSRGISDIHVQVSWENDDQNSYYVMIEYFDAEHKCHRYTSVINDNEHNIFDNIY